jgi:hypothetical protein
LGARTAVSAVLMAATLVGVVAPSSTPVAAAGGADENIVVVLEGGGFGHGRGMSQWGSYGWAVDHGQPWTWILDFYYGGTVLSDLVPADFGATAPGRITVRLIANDDAQTSVVSFAGTAQWAGAPGRSFASLVARENGTNGRYAVWGLSADAVCPAPADPLNGPSGGPTNAVWELLTTDTPTPRFTTPSGDDAGAAASALLGVCRPDGSVVHYRGSVLAVNGSAGEDRTVNDVALESYLRGVVPRESPASWGNAGGGAGINALRAQAVAARSYAVAQGRYTYADTCDTQSCQVYEGAAFRTNTLAAMTIREDSRTDQAIADTSGKIRRKNGAVVSTEFSSSNSARTAGGAFPAVDDAGDATFANPNHVWTRVLDAREVASRFGVPGGTLTAVAKERDPSLAQYDGWWGERVRLAGTSSLAIPAASFRSAYNLPSQAFTMRLVPRRLVTAETFAFIGDSVGVSIADGPTSELQRLLEGVYGASSYDAVVSRCTVGNCVPGATDGVGAAANVAVGTHLVVVELGYNDSASNLAAEIDQVMAKLRERQVGVVAWVNMSTRRSGYAASNAALQAATGRWSNLTVLDWNAASSGPTRDRWYADGVHLTSTGQAELALWLREQVIELSAHRMVVPQFPLQLKVAGVGNVPAGVAAVALDVTAVGAAGEGYVTVYPCATGQPEASNLNYRSTTGAVANSVIAPVDANGQVCLFTFVPAHLIVDVSAWFTAGLTTEVPRRILDTRNAIGAPTGKVSPASPLRLKVTGSGPVPASGVAAVALNITATEAEGEGYVTVYPCASGRPEASNLNYRSALGAVANSVIAPVDANGEICLYTYARAHLIADISGWFGGSGVTTEVPRRILDTRNAIGAPRGKVSPASPMRLKVAGVGPVPASAAAVALNVTATEPDAEGYVTVYPCATGQPETSNLNYRPANGAVANSVIAPVDANGEICLYTYAPAHLVVDISGWFTAGVATQVPSRVLDTRNGIGPIPRR